MPNLGPFELLIIVGIPAAIAIPLVRASIKKSEDRGGSDASVVKEIATYKKLLDDGVITQEEYDKKKSELMGA